MRSMAHAMLADRALTLTFAVIYTLFAKRRKCQVVNLDLSSIPPLDL